MSIFREMEAQEARYEDFLEEERHYTSIRADFKVVDGKKEKINTREVIVLKMDSDDYF
jgi:hypothetical protein